MLRAWNNFWFAPTPCFDLAVVRIVSCVAALFYAWYYRDLHAVVDGLGKMPNETYDPFLLFKLLNAPFGWGTGADGVWVGRPPAEFVSGVFTVFVVSTIMAMIGLLTNISLFVAGLSLLYTALYVYGFGDFHHPMPVMIIALLAFSLSPAGRVLSVDSLIRNRGRHVDVLSEWSIFAGWPLKLVMWLFSLFYLSAVFSKLSRGGLDWANGYTLQWYLARAGSAKGQDFGMWLSQHHMLILLTQIGVLVFQATFFLCILFPKLRWIYVPAGLALHISIYITLGAHFFTWIGLYSVFIPWSVVALWLGRTRSPSPAI